MTPPNIKHKDTFFKFIFGSDERKEYTLALYNALNGTHYDNVDDLTINTLEDVFYIDMKNDVSFIFDSHLYLYEHQSTPNPNMPTRMLLYTSKLIDKLIKEKNLNLFSRRKQYIPAPKFVVFYNGREDLDEMITYKLSDLFENGYKGDIEIEVICYNINGTHNKKLKDSCKVLDEYSCINDNIQQRQNEGMSLIEAIEVTLSNIPDTFILKQAIEENRSAVMGVLEKELTREEYGELERKDGYLDGYEDGQKKNRLQVASSMLSDNFPDKVILKHSGITQEDLNQLKSNNINIE